MACPVPTSPSQITLAPRSSTALVSRPVRVPAPRSQAGSQTTEYALVMVLAATVAALALAWARNGGVSSLLSGVLKHVRSMVGIG
jgi:hypothetical protein